MTATVRSVRTVVPKPAAAASCCGIDTVVGSYPTDIHLGDTMFPQVIPQQFTGPLIGSLET